MTNYLKFEWFDPPNGTAVLKGSREGSDACYDRGSTKSFLGQIWKIMIYLIYLLYVYHLVLHPPLRGVVQGLHKVQAQPRKHVPDGAEFSAPTRQHELDHEKTGDR